MGEDTEDIMGLLKINPTFCCLACPAETMRKSIAWRFSLKLLWMTSRLSRHISPLCVDAFGFPRGFCWRTFPSSHSGRPVRVSLMAASSDPAPTFEETKTLQPGHLYESEMEVKKSRFIGYAQHAASWEEAQQVLLKVRNIHPKARHWCHAYRGGGGGSNTMTERSSDDGEPSGTAGAPILAALSELTDTVCVVVRYFGGIKLGAGGLIRAYGGAARQVIQTADIQVCIPQTTIGITVDAAFVGVIYEMAAKYGGITSAEEYEMDGSLSVNLVVESNVSSKVRNDLKDATRGSVLFHDEAKESES